MYRPIPERFEPATDEGQELITATLATLVDDGTLEAVKKDRTTYYRLAEEYTPMSVILEFTLPLDSFPFGRSTSGDPSVRVRLERLVPLRESRVPFLWATGEDFESADEE